MACNAASKIHAVGIRKIYNEGLPNEIEAIRDVSLEIFDGEFIALLGPSGCGKSTFLYMVGGFEKLTSGSLTLNDEPIAGPGANRGIVFQEYVLFPWLNVYNNIAYGLRLKGASRPEIEEAVSRLVEMIGLEGFEHHFPNALSGGMQQRVAIARAMAYNPDVLLMDEPFGALDAQTRSQMIQDLAQVHEETGKTTLFVTHSVDEAILLADRVFLFSARPSRIKRIFPIDLPHPRAVTDKRFQEIQKEILKDLSEEFGKNVKGTHDQ